MSADETPIPDTVLTPRPRRRRRWPWVVLGLVALAAAFVALLPSILSTSVARDAILSWLADNVDRKVSFEKLDISWAHGIRLEGLRVGDEDPRVTLLEAPLTELDAPILPLLFGKVQVEKFVVRDPVLYVVAKGEKESNVEGVVKKKKVRKKHAAEEEETVLPEIRVPVEVTNLTVVFRARDGREARRSGIDFHGRLDTRDGPTNFDLNVREVGLRVVGDAKLFAADGTFVPAAERKVNAVVSLAQIDAAKNGDFLALFFGDTPASGVLDGKIVLHLVGPDAQGEVDLRLSKLGYGDAAKAAAAKQGDDLTIVGRFSKSAGKIQITGWKVRADGLVLDADLAGGFESMEGRATVDADLARIAGALRAMGFETAGKLSGRLAGTMQFSPSPSKGTGDFALTGLRVEGLVADRPPATIESARIRFEVVPSSERFTLESFEATLPDLTATAHGSRASDGTLDFTAAMKGDLGGALARIRDLGFLPGEFAVNGTIDGEVHVAGKGDALVVELPRLTLVEKDARIEASGTRAADGALDFKASGSGDLGALFGRAAAAGAGPKGLENVKGRFAFEATAKGKADAVAVDVPKLSVDGDILLDAHGRLAPDGAIDAEVAELSGRIDDVLLLLKRTGFLDRDVSIPGRVSLTATVKGTRAHPEIPRVTLTTSDGPVVSKIGGSLSASGVISASATIEADLAAVADVALHAGFVEKRLPMAGKAMLRATATGTREKIEVPEFRLVVAGGPADADVVGKYGADGSISATATVSGEVDRLVLFAQEQGLLKRAATTGCKFHFRAVASGTKDRYEVPDARFAVTGPLRIDATGRMNTDRAFEVSGRADGAVQTLLDLAGAWSGEPAHSLDGTVRASFGASGTVERFDATMPQFAIATRGVQIDGEGSRKADGTASGKLKVAGPVSDLLTIARSFGFAGDVEATGRLDADVAGSLVGRKAEGSLTLVATDLVVAKPMFADVPFREPRFAVTLPKATYDLDARRLDPVKARIELEGARLEATASTAGDLVTLDGTLVAEQRFALNHVEPRWGASWQILSGPFQFSGDPSKGREGAATWTGGFTLTAGGATAPHVSLSKAKLVGKIADGFVVVDPIDAVLNGGPVTGKATIGLVGDQPAHRLVLSAKDVEIDAELAPLVAHASPLFAVGEEGRTGGKGSVECDLAARGMDSKAVRKTLEGQGTLGLDGAFVQSTNWIGELTKFAGLGDRLDLPDVKIPFKVGAGKVETAETPVGGSALSILLGGDASLIDGKLDYLLRVKSDRAGGLMAKAGSLLDKDGYLPLRLGGTLSKPKLKLPDLKDALTDRLGDLLGGRKKDEDDQKDKGKKKPKPDAPPKSGETPPKPSETPPLPPPPGADEPPPPPPPGEGEEEPPPPPPPK